MIRQARAIVAQRQTPWEKALAIYEWVHRNVAKEMTISLPSALDVLHTLKGDCNEHTYLSVALARAAGLPAKIVVGIVYHEGAFYYHAWPSIYAGRWIEMDPTWGQPTVDATHLALVEGEKDQQVQIIKVLGQLKIQVIEETGHD
jgi:transglutaminase-like putative cysteine protease